MSPTYLFGTSFGSEKKGAEYHKQRAKVGLLIMSMGKGSIVGKNEVVSSYQPSKEVAQ